MKLEKKVVIEEADVSELHHELTGMFDLLCYDMPPQDAKNYLHGSFPALVRLQRILEGVIISEPSSRVYEHFSAKEKTEKKKRRKNLKMVSPHEA